MALDLRFRNPSARCFSQAEPKLRLNEGPCARVLLSQRNSTVVTPASASHKLSINEAKREFHPWLPPLSPFLRAGCRVGWVWACWAVSPPRLDYFSGSAASPGAEASAGAREQHQDQLTLNSPAPRGTTIPPASARYKLAHLSTAEPPSITAAVTVLLYLPFSALHQPAEKNAYNYKFDTTELNEICLIWLTGIQ
ncbi:hypothetical protein Z043_115099 [Scleropages formosus]|uniref:Uncharacterized protein n=1 Tax=Scleropages formosus TaxID=113540 RepID=A0A0P7TY56_SCLFO|nr:hypothetical protein Z043_115099 [Scleropages formosus]